MAFTNTTDWEYLFPPQVAAIKTQPSTILGMSDFHASVFVPVIAFWVVCAFFETCDYFDWFPQYRVVPSRDELRRNLVSRGHVARTAFRMHCIQMAFGLATPLIFPSKDEIIPPGAFGTVEYFGMVAAKYALRAGLSLDRQYLILAAHALRWSFLIGRQLGCFFILDTWGYWVHYTMHVYPTLYRKYHAMHHQNYVPYSYAAGYNHFVEGFSDILAAAVAAKVFGISDREATVFFTIAALKAVDDHSGLMLPFSPFRLWRWIFGNGPVFHTIHHQRWGFKSNFEIFFCFWDYVNLTMYSGSRIIGDSWEKKYVEGEAKFEAKIEEEEEKKNE